MSTVTNIKYCKRKMSKAGWALFCEHRRNDTLAPFNPETCADDEEVLLTRLERAQYEYGYGSTNS